MAKKKQSKWDLQHLRNLMAVENDVDACYRAAVDRIMKLNYSRIVEDGVLFSFNPSTLAGQQVKQITKDLTDEVTAVIMDGINTAWELSNAKNDALVAKYLNGAKDLPANIARRYLSTNDGALAAFAQRKVDGLRLSDRVWRYTDQFKSEIEMAIDIGLRDGRSADKLSRDVRAYLQNPDGLFRRVRDEHGNLVLSKTAKAYHPGRGVYRSAYKNARRLASTECNIAYHKADKERWQRLDFVVGFKVVPSKNHLRPDMCDDLQGDYPKTFDFSGWHPHCRCHAEPILKTLDEVKADNRAIINGGEPSEGSVNMVNSVPKGFEDWVVRNQSRIETANSLPYFIRDNKAVVERILSPKKTALEIAVERHAKRPQSRRDDIIKLWDERNTRLEREREKEIHRAEVLQKAKERHAARTKKKVGEIKRAWNKRVQEINTKQNVNRALDITEWWYGRTDTQLAEELRKAFKKRNYSQMRKITDLIFATIRNERDELKPYQDLIPNIRIARRHTSAYKIKELHSEVSNLLDKWGAKELEQASRANLLGLNTEVEEKIKGFWQYTSPVERQLYLSLHRDIKAVIDPANSIAARAAKRHSARTEEHITSIRERWERHKDVSQKTSEAANKFRQYCFTQRIDIESREYVARNGMIELNANLQERIWQATFKRVGNTTHLYDKNYGYVLTGSSFEINKALREGTVLKLSAEQQKTITIMDDVITKFSFPFPIKTVRFVEMDALPSMFGESIPIADNKKAVEAIKRGMKKITEQGYMSVSLDVQHNVFTTRGVRLDIEVPAGKNFYLTYNFPESEVILGRNTALECLTAEIQGEQIIMNAKVIK